MCRLLFDGTRSVMSFENPSDEARNPTSGSNLWPRNKIFQFESYYSHIQSTGIKGMRYHCLALRHGFSLTLELTDYTGLEIQDSACFHLLSFEIKGTPLSHSTFSKLRSTYLYSVSSAPPYFFFLLQRGGTPHSLM